MTLQALLSDSGTIYNRSVDPNVKTTSESWAAQSSPVACRVLKRAISSRTVEKAQNATTIQTRVMLPKGAVIAIRDRFKHDGRMYSVIEVVEARRVRTVPYKIAICEGIAGGV